MQDYILTHTFRMMRYFTIFMMTFICTVTFGSFGITLAQKAFAANIKNLVVVEDSIIRAGDIFENMPDNADRVLGAAPAPGQDMTINSRTLLRIALALNVPWRPASIEDHVIVRRSATIISSKDIERELSASLRDKGVKDNFNLKFNYPVKSFVLPEAENNSVAINKISYDPTHGVFEAEIVAPSIERPLHRQVVHGSIERLVSIPVLNKALQSGTLISGHDIDWIEVPADQIQHNIVLKADDIIGMTPRRMVMAGEPLRMQQIAEPLLVERGDLITLNYTEGPIHLSTEAKALQDGAKGDIIRVVNLATNRTLEAMINGSRTVIVK